LKCESFGEDILLLERREFLRLLYENLPNKSAIRFNQKVLSVEDDHEGVTVHLGNGEKLHADMVIGCDGVHSAVREAMWRNANASIPGYISAREKKCEPLIRAHHEINLANKQKRSPPPGPA
jgi:2-polyprenyl-6-methoxyphenol hydroxylase-like FAD-dependent oxidoreductase